MTPVVGCEVARPLLGEFVDGELAVEAQLLVDGHLRSCRSCANHVDDLRLMGDDLRMVAGARVPALDLEALVRSASSRAQAEHALSWATSLRRLADDRRVAWSLAGATCGVLLCALLTAAVVVLEIQTASSLGAVMRVLASPGSDLNPLQLNARMLPPRLAIPAYADDAPELYLIPTEDHLYAIAATVTRQGRLSEYEVLGADRQEPAFPMAPGSDEQMRAQAVSRIRFAPAQSGGEPVAVNMVWVVARTTVRGRAIDVPPPGQPRRSS